MASVFSSLPTSYLFHFTCCKAQMGSTAPLLSCFNIFCDGFSGSFPGFWVAVVLLAELNLSLVNHSSFIFIAAVLTGTGWYVNDLSLGTWLPRCRLGPLFASLVISVSSRPSCGFLWNSPELIPLCCMFFGGYCLNRNYLRSWWLSRVRKTISDPFPSWISSLYSESANSIPIGDFLMQTV